MERILRGIRGMNSEVRAIMHNTILAGGIKNLLDSTHRAS
jgi:hypothetical protein